MNELQKLLENAGMSSHDDDNVIEETLDMPDLDGPLGHMFGAEGGEDEDAGWGDELIEDLRLLLQESHNEQDLRGGIEQLIQQYESTNI